MHLMTTAKVADVRAKFIELLANKQFTENQNKTGSKTVEIINASFIADEPAIFGEVNKDWVERESKWYHGQSLNINDIPGGAPAVWKMVATEDGRINSNYGWCIFSADNGYQFHNCAKQLEMDEQSRRAEMIYTRPNIQVDYNKDGMSDFICTEVVQYFIRNGELIACVKMRSNDAIFGYKGDKAWQEEVQFALWDRLARTYPNLKIGPIIWNAGSIHVYSRHFHLIK
jgi:thymidylate synthase